MKWVNRLFGKKSETKVSETKNTTKPKEATYMHKTCDGRIYFTNEPHDIKEWCDAMINRKRY